jgi:hypothetical protein
MELFPKSEIRQFKCNIPPDSQYNPAYFGHLTTERRQNMRCNLFTKSLIVSFVLLTAVAAFAAPAGTPSTVNSGNAFRTSLMPDLSFKTVLSSELLPHSGVTQVALGTKTCRCSCGFPCATNADCGPGGICSVGITCCNRDPQGDAQAWVQESALSSRSTPGPDWNSKCK